MVYLDTFIQLFSQQTGIINDMLLLLLPNPVKKEKTSFLKAINLLLKTEKVTPSLERKINRLLWGRELDEEENLALSKTVDFLGEKTQTSWSDYTI